MKIIITGASRGLGFELAAAAALQGHQVIAGVRDPSSANLRYDSLDPSVRSNVLLHALDVTKDDSIAELVGKLEDEHVAVDALVNNAGILLGRDDDFETMSFQDVAASFATNLFGPIKMIQALLPLLRKAKLPSIMNISSEAGAYAGVTGGDYPYGLSKSGLTYLSEKLRQELEPQGFQVIAVHPGWIRTDMGGMQAPGDPAEAAGQLLSILERVRPLKLTHGFIDPAGRELSI